MPQGRGYHSATLMNDGTVLLYGGGPNGSTAVVYNPVSGQWSAIASATNSRFAPLALRCYDHRLLVAGGGTSEIFDPSSGAWTSLASMLVSRAYHRSALLANGKVLATGGTDLAGNIFNSAEMYDPATNQWSLPTCNPWLSH